jgi:ribosome biogenesis protein MAK21
MKSIVVREIISLVLKPSAPSATKTQHIRFSSPEPASKSKSQDKKLANSHAQYYATITFNQIVLTPTSSDREVAIRLIDIYFELFKDVLGSESEKTEELDEKLLEKDGEVQKDKNGRVLVKNKRKEKKGKEVSGAAGFVEVEDSNSKLVSALLTGVNRALPFAKVEVGDTKCVS